MTNIPENQLTCPNADFVVFVLYEYCLFEVVFQFALKLADYCVAWLLAKS